MPLNKTMFVSWEKYRFEFINGNCQKFFYIITISKDNMVKQSLVNILFPNFEIQLLVLDF